MAKKPKKAEKDLKTWLLEFERHVGKGVVVSLLIERGHIKFMACIDRKRFMDSSEEPDDEEGEEIIPQSKKELSKIPVSSYIG